jgi:serine/threonine-protein kinase HipA
VLCLNVTDDNNSLDLDLALEIADYCRLTQPEAKSIIQELQKAITPWRKIASHYKIAKAEQDRMAYAFRLAH